MCMTVCLHESTVPLYLFINPIWPWMYKTVRQADCSLSPTTPAPRAYKDTLPQFEHNTMCTDLVDRENDYKDLSLLCP